MAIISSSRCGVARVQGDIPDNAILLVGNGYLVITITPEE